MSTSLLMFLVFIAITLVITYWASKRSAGASAYFAASRQITAWQNGVAVAGDYMSAASFLGIAGLIAFSGYDGFMCCWWSLSRCAMPASTPWLMCWPIG
jgi:cation/acetate symporter